MATFKTHADRAQIADAVRNHLAERLDWDALQNIDVRVGRGHVVVKLRATVPNSPVPWESKIPKTPQEV